jgi:hypothetical protein
MSVTVETVVRSVTQIGILWQRPVVDDFRPETKFNKIINEYIAYKLCETWNLFLKAAPNK